jgi:hypothetical protein
LALSELQGALSEDKKDGVKPRAGQAVPDHQYHVLSFKPHVIYIHPFPGISPSRRKQKPEVLQEAVHIFIESGSSKREPHENFV